MKPMSLEAKDNRIGVCFLLPAVGVLLLIVAYPVIYSVAMSFFRWRPTENAHPFVGLLNYRKVVGSPVFFRSICNTLIYAFVGVLCKILIGLGLALLLNKDFRGRGLARSLLLLPWVIPVTASLTTWNWMFDGMDGIVNIVAMRLGLISQNMNLLGETTSAFICILIAGIWMGYPLIMLMILAGLQAIPPEQYEAAKVEGARPWQAFRSITLPALAGVMKTAIILSVIWTFNAFNVIWLLTRGGPSNSTHIMNTLAYELSFVNMKYDQGAAMAVLILVLLMVFLFLYSRLRKSEEVE